MKPCCKKAVKEIFVELKKGRETIKRSGGRGIHHWCIIEYAVAWETVENIKKKLSLKEFYELV